MENENQPALDIVARPNRTVHWLNGVKSEERVYLFFKRVFTEPMLDELSRPQKTEIATDDIDKVQDPNLRYALRFAAAAEAVGTVPDGYGGSDAHTVNIFATDEGFNSKLISAMYTGKVVDGCDTFLERLSSVHTDEAN
jgi:hypothetical protein